MPDNPPRSNILVTVLAVGVLVAWWGFLLVAAFGVPVYIVSVLVKWAWGL